MEIKFKSLKIGVIIAAVMFLVSYNLENSIICILLSVVIVLATLIIATRYFLYSTALDVFFDISVEFIVYLTAITIFFWLVNEFVFTSPCAFIIGFVSAIIAKNTASAIYKRIKYPRSK